MRDACYEINEGSNVSIVAASGVPLELKFYYNNVWHLIKNEGSTYDSWILIFEGHKVFAMQEYTDRDYVVLLCEFDCDRQVLKLFLDEAVEQHK